MATKQSSVDYIMEQMGGAGVITARKMFGEYGVYCDGKIVSLVCDDMLFMKPTEAGRKYIGAPEMAPPYPGAKEYFLIVDVDDSGWLSELVRVSARELKIRKKK